MYFLKHSDKTLCSIGQGVSRRVLLVVPEQASSANVVYFSEVGFAKVFLGCIDYPTPEKGEWTVCRAGGGEVVDSTLIE
jgi:hypothetical protein